MAQYLRFTLVFWFVVIVSSIFSKHLWYVACPGTERLVMLIQLPHNTFCISKFRHHLFAKCAHLLGRKLDILFIKISQNSIIDFVFASGLLVQFGSKSIQWIFFTNNIKPVT